MAVPVMAQTLKNLPAIRETWVQSLSQEDSLEKGMVTHSSILAWRGAWWATVRPRGRRVRQDYFPMTSLVAQTAKNLPAMQGTQV